MKSKSKTNDSSITNDKFRKKKVKTGKGKKEKAKGKENDIGFLDQHRNIKRNQKESKKSDHNVQAIQKAKENYRSKPWRTSG